MNKPNERTSSFPAIGCCLTTGSFMPQSGNTEASQKDPADVLLTGINGLLQSGYDFAELTVGALAQLSEDEFARLQSRLKEEGIAIPVFNSFIPPALKLTGPETQAQAIEEYVAKAMKRVHEVGGEMIIFGSGGARTVPEGYAVEQGLQQIKDFLTLCDRYADQYDLIVAIEPLNRKESNVINKVEEALDVALELNLRHIQVLADAYHMHLEQESPEIVKRAVESNLLAHVHYAEFDRSFPSGTEDAGVDLRGLFTFLRDCGYQGRVSAECMGENVMVHNQASLRYVRNLLVQLHERGE
ncbi:hypothetical protein GCM10023310_63850 [Paenibacillus vulneris]|uniref:Sugar phosphate isomerase/epimerase family protein n=1 Tax=Paenibacillus vulneris TaxID=1133364 RepID=A0ABW3UX34_9BACL